jgi:apolipoprotein N-acyltransferase
MTGPGRQRDATGQWWVFVVMFVVFLAGAIWFFSRGQVLGGAFAAAIAVVDLALAVVYLLNARRAR